MKGKLEIRGSFASKKKTKQQKKDTSLVPKYYTVEPPMSG